MSTYSLNSASEVGGKLSFMCFYFALILGQREKNFRSGLLFYVGSLQVKCCSYIYFNEVVFWTDYLKNFLHIVVLTKRL